jgi:hypothetical protein
MNILNSVLDFIWKYKLWPFLISLFVVVSGAITIYRYFRHQWRDLPIFDFLEEQKPTDSGHGGKVYYPYSVKQIAEHLERKEKSVLRSLKRLKKGKRGDQVVEDVYGWYTKANSRN